MGLKKLLPHRLKDGLRTVLEFAGIDRYSHPALNGLDYKLAKYLNCRNGFFIEIGANDGFTQSNTYYFEKLRGWHGVLIEPIPSLYKQAVRRRVHSRVFNCACVPFGYTDTHVKMIYSNLMSLVEGALHDPAAEASHIACGNTVQNVQSYEILVPARTLTSILDECKVSHIDLLSLDVEGYEVDVLRGLDFSRYPPQYMLVEVHFRDELEALISDRYECIERLTDLDFLYRLRS
jgi:FkbM family methyltransferase